MQPILEFPDIRTKNHIESLAVRLWRSESFSSGSTQGTAEPEARYHPLWRETRPLRLRAPSIAGGCFLSIGVSCICVCVSCACGVPRVAQRTWKAGLRAKSVTFLRFLKQKGRQNDLQIDLGMLEKTDLKPTLLAS